MNRPHYFEGRAFAPPPPGEAHQYVSLRDLFLLLRANLPLLLLATAVAAMIGASYFILMPSTYRAQTQLQLDTKLPQIFREASDLGLNIDTGQIETHMVALRSRAIATSVVRRLELWKDPNFQRYPSVLDRLLIRIGVSRPVVTTDPLQTAADIYLRNLSVEREGISQVINVAFYSRDRERAAAVANETAGAYIQYLIDVRADAARTASEWLEHRLEQLRLQMNAAAKRAQNFRASNERSVTLEELQLSAETYRKVYQDFYSAFTEAVQRESYPVSTARVISEAITPVRPSSPRFVLVLGSAMLIGMAIGLLLAILRESGRAAPSGDRAGGGP